MKIKLLTLFPEYFDSVFKTSIIGKAIAEQKVEIEVLNIRDFTTDKHQITDDRPFGGGPGMVLKIEPIHRALQSLGYDFDTRIQEKSKVVLTSAKGKKFTQSIAAEYSEIDELVIICGHYEGVDERVADNLIDEEIRIGDYVLTGGEPAAAVIIDAVTRLVDGVLGNPESITKESQEVPGKLGYPSYTRPAEYLGKKIPEVLLSGDHQKISAWRKEQESYEKDESGTR